jgi:hypothetical protein
MVYRKAGGDLKTGICFFEATNIMYRGARAGIAILWRLFIRPFF